MATAGVGVVVIGRNEGDRLALCLASAAGQGILLVYVDSGSSDDSVAIARRMGCDVVELDSSVPFSAARARNEGFERLLHKHPETAFVQFVDGDCELRGEWLSRAAETLENDPSLAVVCGRLRERSPEASIYNRLCDMEWDGSPGEIKACGGVAMYRVSVFKEAEGFDPTVVAGEEPELCLRLRRRGWRIVRLPAEMAWHDAAMLRFGQWWRRAVRGGYGGLDVASRFERDGGGIFAGQVRSARLWALGWPAFMGAVTALGGLYSGLPGAAGAAALAVLLLPLQMVRLTVRTRRRGTPWAPSVACGFLTMVAKWASLVGQFQYWLDRRSGRRIRLIEHKGAAASGMEHS